MGSFLGQQRPLVIAHRGASALAPEMTMAAYQQAVNDLADGYECDVQLTKDLIPVCFHDTNLNRTSNGFGRLGAKTLAELEKFDYGSWFSKPNLQFSEQQWTGLVTLNQLLEFVSAQKNAPIMLVETKHASSNGLKLEAAAIAAIKKYGLDNLDPTKPRAALMSFSVPALRRAKNIDPNLYTVLLLDKRPPALSAISDFVGSNAWGLGVHLLRTNPELVEQARSTGRQVFVWTVDTQEQIELCLKYKVDVIITNNPAATRDTINQLGNN
jgi:glycerophosphoryl diester phosphodiesterase